MLKIYLIFSLFFTSNIFACSFGDATDYQDYTKIKQYNPIFDGKLEEFLDDKYDTNWQYSIDKKTQIKVPKRYEIASSIPIVALSKIQGIDMIDIYAEIELEVVVNNKTHKEYKISRLASFFVKNYNQTLLKTRLNLEHYPKNRLFFVFSSTKNKTLVKVIKQEKSMYVGNKCLSKVFIKGFY
jgi:hypothetical protein